MKKFAVALLVFCLLCCLPMAFVGTPYFSIEKSNFAVAATEKTNSFSKEPTLLSSRASVQDENQFARYIVSANSAVVFSNASPTSEKLATKNHKDEIFVLTSDESPVEEFWKEYKFFKINLQENGIVNENFDYGYVLSDLLIQKQDEIVSIPNFNARTNKECHVFLQENGEFVEIATTLSHGQEIFLYEGFDAKKDFTAISYVHEGKVLYGFLKTDDVSPNGINPVLITCIVLIVAVLSIIFAWLFMKNKHVRLKKHKRGQYDLKTEK